VTIGVTLRSASQHKKGWHKNGIHIVIYRVSQKKKSVQTATTTSSPKHVRKKHSIYYTSIHHTCRCRVFKKEKYRYKRKKERKKERNEGVYIGPSPQIQAS